MKKILFKLLAFLAAAFILATPMPATATVTLPLSLDFSGAYAPSFFTVGGGGVAGNSYTTSSQVGVDFWSDQINIDSIIFGPNMYQVADISGSLDIAGTLFIFTISSGSPDISSFILPTVRSFASTDVVTLTWLCPGACIVGLNAQIGDAHADTNISFTTVGAPIPSVPNAISEPAGLALVFAALAGLGFCSQLDGYKRRKPSLETS